MPDAAGPPPDDVEVANWLAGLLRERYDADDLDVEIVTGDMGTNVDVYEPGTAVERVSVFVTNIERLRRKRREMGLDYGGERADDDV